MTDIPIMTKDDLAAIYAKAARKAGFTPAQAAIWVGFLTPRIRFQNVTGGGVTFVAAELSGAEEAELNELLAQAGKDESQ